MARLLAFQIIGGSNLKPITKTIIAHPPLAGDDPFVGTTYVMSVFKHEDSFSFMPSDYGDLIYHKPCGNDLELAEHLFNECKDFATACEWTRDDVEIDGERRLFERATP
jgi:hypothetical protein